MCVNCLNLDIHTLFPAFKNNDVPEYIFTFKIQILSKPLVSYNPLIFSEISQNKKFM
jgi:hypothetical protein